MVMFLDSQENFRVVISRSIWFILPRQRKNHSGILCVHRRKLVTSIASSYFDARPLPPQIDPGRCLDHLVNVSAAHARGAFEKIEMSVRMRSDEFSMGHAAHQTQRSD